MTPRSDDELNAAGARLAASHASIAQALLPEAPAGEPGVAPAVSALGSSLIVALADRALNPLAQRHPWLLVAGAAALGAAFVTRPWRRAMGAVVMTAVLTPAAGSWALREAARVLGRPARPAPPGPPGGPR
jgi:hypothetical protein